MLSNELTWKFLNLDLMHCFELRTVNIDYFVGQDPMFDLKDGPTELTLPPPDSGIGAYLAKSWETTIRQALMPVTNTSSEFIMIFLNLYIFLLFSFIQYINILCNLLSNLKFFFFKNLIHNLC